MDGKYMMHVGSQSPYALDRQGSDCSLLSLQKIIGKFQGQINSVQNKTKLSRLNIFRGWGK